MLLKAVQQPKHNWTISPRWKNISLFCSFRRVCWQQQKHRVRPDLSFKAPVKFPSAAKASERIQQRPTGSSDRVHLWNGEQFVWFSKTVISQLHPGVCEPLWNPVLSLHREQRREWIKESLSENAYTKPCWGRRRDAARLLNAAVFWSRQ